MVNQWVLPRPLVQALQRRGYEVIASCVWELRSRQHVRQLGVDGAFVNLYDQAEHPEVQQRPVPDRDLNPTTGH